MDLDEQHRLDEQDILALKQLIREAIGPEWKLQIIATGMFRNSKIKVTRLDSTPPVSIEIEKDFDSFYATELIPNIPMRLDLFSGKYAILV